MLCKRQALSILLWYAIATRLAGGAAANRLGARRLLKAQKMRVGALATLKANRQLGVPPEAASAAAPAPAGPARDRVRGNMSHKGLSQALTLTRRHGVGQSGPRPWPARSCEGVLHLLGVASDLHKVGCS